jgi:hypothetical protein
MSIMENNQQLNNEVEHELHIDNVSEYTNFSLFLNNIIENNKIKASFRLDKADKKTLKIYVTCHDDDLPILRQFVLDAGKLSDLTKNI